MYYTENTEKVYKPKVYRSNEDENEDIILNKNFEFKSNKDYEEDMFKLKEEDYKPQELVVFDTLRYIEANPIINKYKYHSDDDYKTRQYGDTDFYKWLLIQGHDSCIAILAEIVNAPKLSSKIEKIRPTVKDMPTMTIEEFRKLKCIGSTKVKWLKQLKKTYGINLLRFLKASIS